MTITRFSSASADEALTGWTQPTTIQQSTSLLIGQQAQPMHQAPETSRVHSGTVRFDGQSMATSSQGTERHTISYAGVEGGSVLATRQRQNGVDTVELVPGNPASRTQLRMALADGLIRETSPGIYADATSTTTGQQLTATDTPQQQQQEANKAPVQADPGAEVFHRHEDQAFAQAIDPLPQHAYDSAIASATRAILASESGFDCAVHSLAQNAGIDPAQAADLIQAGYSHFERAASRAVAPLGITGERKAEFYEYARSNPQRLQEAMQALTLARDPSKFKALGVAFNVARPGPEVAGLKASGFEVFIDRDTGHTMARRPGQGWKNVTEGLRT